MYYKDNIPFEGLHHIEKMYKYGTFHRVRKPNNMYSLSISGMDQAKREMAEKIITRSVQVQFGKK